MKISSSLTCVLLLLLSSSSTVTSRNIFRTDLSQSDIEERSFRDYVAATDAPRFFQLVKRKGGGGGGGGGRSGGGSSGGSAGGRSGGGGKPSGGKPGGSSGNSGGSGGSRPVGTRPNSNVGGSSRSGSGSPRSFGGGSSYAGGAGVPYTAGRRSPKGLTPFLLPLAALAFFPGLWLFGAYAYETHHGFDWRNRTSGLNQSVPIVCLCQQYSECGCDDNNNSTYIQSVLNDTDMNGLPRNSSLVKTVNVNGTTKIYINGTLPNGTTAPDPSISGAMSARGMIPQILKLSGYWSMFAIVFATVMLL
ncbi:hypothetical protein PRK78_005366 [Emydomyces testavorans]|uniref:DUF7732 domain-containing protein n=1 Tax=Emydomyces testavorans TaxID=2070801 RepID=A0AAF0DN92_9EURO|nr:hypothetical protein PRK78_005366 [Emydomyces testavorans]